MRIPFDIIDILILSYIVYKAVGFLRETRAGQLVKGMVFLLGLYLIANWWDLASLKWILSKIMDAAIIAFAVIFQPELRRILEKVGRTKLGVTSFIDDKNERVSECIDAVSHAVGLMQESRTGALIVFERSTQLGEIINTGTVIDAAASISMIGNIFFQNSPLHDGALIVRDGRLYAAGCILPLTAREDLSSQLGTRHRAAIGMTENSDAVVLVVSEETGNISIAMNGVMRRNFNAASVADELRRHLLDQSDENQTGTVATAFKYINPFKKAKGKGAEKKNESSSSNSD